MNGKRGVLVAALLVVLVSAFSTSTVFAGHKPNHSKHGHSENVAPTVSITSPADMEALPSGVPVTFEGTASDAEDGDLTAGLVWVSNINGGIGTGGAISATLNDGYHTITASVIDLGGKTGSASVRITIGNPEASRVGVVSIDYVPLGDKHVSVIFTVRDDLGEPVASAAITATLFRNGREKDTDTLITGAGGVVTVDGGKGPPGTYTIEINNVVAYGLEWDGLTPSNSFTE